MRNIIFNNTFKQLFKQILWDFKKWLNYNEIACMLKFLQNFFIIFHAYQKNVNKVFIFFFTHNFKLKFFIFIIIITTFFINLITFCDWLLIYFNHDHVYYFMKMIDYHCVFHVFIFYFINIIKFSERIVHRIFHL